MKSAARMVLLNIILLVLLVGGAIIGYYYYTQSINYLKTNNARVDGRQVAIVSPAAGRLTDWNGDIGKTFGHGDRIGIVQTSSGTVDITAPQAATIVQQNAVTNMVVAPGAPLAYAYDLERLWVTANIKETDFSDVKPGQAVDVYVDAYPGTTLTGKMDKIGLATAGTFSLLPSANTTGNYTKVTQVIPTTISIDSYRGITLLPGMSVTVRIHL